MTTLLTDAGWTMLHTLWIGAGLGALGGLARLVLARARPELRHAVALLLFTALVLTPAVVFQVLQAGGPDVGDTPSPAGPLGAAPTQTLVGPVDDALSPWIARLPWLWLAGTTLTLAGLLRGAFGVVALRRDVQPAPSRTRALAGRLASELGAGMEATVVVSSRVAAPVLLGIVRPLIVLPPALLAGLTPRQLELVLLHELAHLRRRDNLVIAWQRLGEALICFHPVTWWLSRWLRLERESCCDALVLRHSGQPQDYVRTLLAVADGGSPRLAAAMARHDLPQRVSRILGRRERPMPTLGTTTAVSLTLLAGLGVLASDGLAHGPHDEPTAAPVALPDDTWSHPPVRAHALPADCASCHVTTPGAAQLWPTRVQEAPRAPQPAVEPVHPTLVESVPRAPHPLVEFVHPARVESVRRAPYPVHVDSRLPEDQTRVRDLLSQARQLLQDEEALRADPASVRDRLAALLGGQGAAPAPSAVVEVPRELVEPVEPVEPAEPVAPRDPAAPGALLPPVDGAALPGWIRHPGVQGMSCTSCHVAPAADPFDAPAAVDAFLAPPAATPAESRVRALHDAHPAPVAVTQEARRAR